MVSDAPGDNGPTAVVVDKPHGNGSKAQEVRRPTIGSSYTTMCHAMISVM